MVIGCESSYSPEQMSSTSGFSTVLPVFYTQKRVRRGPECSISCFHPEVIVLLIFYWWCALLLSHVWLFGTPWTVARQAPLSVEFSWQEKWSGLPFYSPGVESTSPASPASQVMLHCQEAHSSWLWCVPLSLPPRSLYSRSEESSTEWFPKYMR